jgi:hypothetical protein
MGSRKTLEFPLGGICPRPGLDVKTGEICQRDGRMRFWRRQDNRFDRRFRIAS